MGIAKITDLKENLVYVPQGANQVGKDNIIEFLRIVKGFSILNKEWQGGEFFFSLFNHGREKSIPTRRPVSWREGVAAPAPDFQHSFVFRNNE